MVTSFVRRARWESPSGTEATRRARRSRTVRATSGSGRYLPTRSRSTPATAQEAIPFDTDPTMTHRRRSVARRLTTYLALAALLPLAPRTLDAQLNAEEQEIAMYLEHHSEEAVALLDRIVNVNSGTMNFEGNRAVAEILIPEFEALGFEARWVPLPAEVDRSGHLVAVRRGTQGKKLLLIGHLDTVFEEADGFQTFTRDGGRATGPGVVDMKGGNISILFAIKALDHAGVLDGAEIRVVMTGDEESPGRPLDITRQALMDAARESDIALGFEGGSRGIDTEYAVIARRSSSSWTLRVTGTQAHSSSIFSEGTGAGAIFEAARILSDFYDEVRGEQYLTFNAGAIVGGTEVDYDPQATRGSAFGKTNVVPNTVVVHGGIRTISMEQLESARDRMRAVVARHLPRTDAEIEFSDGYPPMPPTDANRALLDQYSQASLDLGHSSITPFDPGARGAADVSFVADLVEASIDGLGPHGSGGHTPDEAIDLATWPVTMQRAAILIYRLTR